MSENENDVKDLKSEFNGLKLETKEAMEVEELRIPMPFPNNSYIAAKAWGNSENFPVLCVHGFQDNAGTFDRLIPLLPKNFYYVAIDLGGHGRSFHLPSGVNYHYSDSLLVLRRIANYFKWSKFNWIGHSMGAGLGAFYASCFHSQVNYYRASLLNKQNKKSEESKIDSPLKTQVHKLVMLDLIKPITGPPEDISNKTAQAIDAFLSMEKKLNSESPMYSYEDCLKRLMIATENQLDEESAKILLSRGIRRVTEDQYRFTRDIRLVTPSIYRYTHEQFYDILSSLICPLLLIKATKSPWYEGKEVCNKTLEVYKKSSSDFRFVEVEGNHFIHLNSPEKISDLVGNFLNDKRSSL